MLVTARGGSLLVAARGGPSLVPTEVGTTSHGQRWHIATHGQRWTIAIVTATGGPLLVEDSVQNNFQFSMLQRSKTRIFIT